MHDIREQINIIWEALCSYRENLLPEGEKEFDSKWEDICLAMAVIQEELGVEEEIHHSGCPALDGFGCHCNELEGKNK